jgi:hypothetical protein
MRTQSSRRHLDVGQNILSDNVRPVEEEDPNACDHGPETLKPLEIVTANTHKNPNRPKNAGGANHNGVVCEDPAHRNFA